MPDLDISLHDTNSQGLDRTISTSNPAVTSNPSSIGHIWINSSTGNVYTCTDNTTNSNVWINWGVGSGNIS